MSRRINDEEIRSEAASSRRYSEKLGGVYKVGVAPKQNIFKEFGWRVKETLFADDPLKPFKNQTGFRKLVLGIQSVFPIVEWGRHYSLSKFKGDLIAGITIAGLCIPQVCVFIIISFRLFLDV